MSAYLKTFEFFFVFYNSGEGLQKNFFFFIIVSFVRCYLHLPIFNT